MDEAELRKQVRSTILSIVGSRPRPETPDKPETISFMGTTILAEPQFFYVVVDRDMAKDGFSYEVTLPDESVVSVSYSQFFVAEQGRLAAFFVYHNAVNYNVDKINAVQFGEEDVSRFDVVRLADFDEHQNFFLPGGRVNDVADHFFMFDCSTTRSTKNTGAPVFNEAGALVGIHYQSPLAPSYAYSLSAIEANLLKLSEVEVQTIEEFFQQVRLSGYKQLKSFFSKSD